MKYLKRFEKLNQRIDNCSYYKIYTLVFALMTLLVFSWFIFNKQSFIWEGDGWSQHFRAMQYYAEYVRQIIATLFTEHRLVIPNWSFSFGEGNDIVSILHYYVIGDPFVVPSILVPSQYMHIYYAFAIVARMYCAGAAFSFLCKEFGQTNKTAILAGSMVYVFCYWNMFNAIRHPYFVNPLIYLPLIVVGVERIIKGKRPYLFIAAVFLCVVSNFYFLYMLALLSVIYVLIRLGFLYKKDIKSAMIPLIKIAASAIAAAIMGAVIVIPIVISVLGDSRLGAGNSLHLFYSLNYYATLPAAFITTSGAAGLCMGFAAPTLLAVFLLMRQKKQNAFIKILSVACLIFLAFPLFGKLFNGFNYVTNRWSWAMALLVAFILTSLWDELMALKSKDAKPLFLGLGIYFILCLLFEQSRNIKTFVGLFFALAFLLIIFPIYSENGQRIFTNKFRQAMCFVLVCASILSNAFWFYSPSGSNYSSEFLTTKYVKENITHDETTALKQLMKDKPFARYSGLSITRNASLTSGLSSTQYYWTNSNSNITDFRRQMEVREQYINLYNGYDGRAALMALSAVKYFVIPWTEKDREDGEILTGKIPYGFEYITDFDAKGDITEDAMEKIKAELKIENLTEEQFAVLQNSVSKEYAIYENKYYLPFGYTYDSYMSREEWETKTATEKQDLMLKTAVLEQEPKNGVPLSKAKSSCKKLAYTLEYDPKDVTVSDGRIVITNPETDVTFNFNSPKNSETYFCISNMSFIDSTEYDLYLGKNEFDPNNIYNKTLWNQLDGSEKYRMMKAKLLHKPETMTKLILRTSSNVRKSLEYDTPEFNYYGGRDSFSVNLGYNEQPLTSVTVKFDKMGIYSFDDLSIVAQPMKAFSKHIAARKQTSLENVEIKTDLIKGTIKLDKPQILCLSIPYSKGFTAFVDGKETELMRVNVKNMALALDSGEHKIELRYSTPYLKVSFMLSVAACTCFVAVYAFDMIMTAKKKRKGQK